MLLQFNHNTLFQKLVELKENHHPVFDYKDYIVDCVKYRIFNYNLANYRSFLEDAAIECRGITFEIDDNNNYVKLASLPMQKFFNYNENPFTEGLENEIVDIAMFKEDGSLMSTYLNNGVVQLKSKGAFFSDQAIAANKVLSENDELRAALQTYEEKGFTVNLEYTAPSNQIVLSYQVDKLTILNVRNRTNGDYLPFEEIEAPFDTIVKSHTQYKGMTLKEFSEIVYSLEDIEGFVVRTKSGHWIKFKTHWYCERHNSISVYSPFSRKGRREIINSVFEERTDDTKQLLIDNPFILKVINMVEVFVSEYIEEIDKDITSFLKENKDLTSEEYYLKAQKVFKDDSIKFSCSLRLKNNSLGSIKEQLVIRAHSSKIERYNLLFDKLKSSEE